MTFVLFAQDPLPKEFLDVHSGELTILVLAAMWYACYWLYQRKIFFKI